MKHLLLFGLMLLSASLFAQDDPEIRRIPDFRDIVWGTHIDSVEVNGEKVNFKKADRANGGDYYIIENDNMYIGSVKLTDIYYVFTKEDNRFFKVILTGKKADVENMQFIVDYKYGDHVNKAELDELVIKQWIIADVTIELRDFAYNKFELELKSDWQAAEDYMKNTNVTDF